MYLDLQGLEHGLPHNSNASQLYLISHLPGKADASQRHYLTTPAMLSDSPHIPPPTTNTGIHAEEPPEVSPASIHGPVLLSAEDFKTECYMDLGEEDWARIKALCKAVQPNAM
jgi:hypothetical protein